MPGDAALVEGWVETTVALLAESRRTHEQAKRQLEVAERAAEKAKGDEPILASVWERSRPLEAVEEVRGSTKSAWQSCKKRSRP